MIKNALLLGAIGLLSLPGYAQKKTAVKGKTVTASPLLKTKLDTVSYGIGSTIGEQLSASLKAQGMDSINTKMFIKAIQDAITNVKPAVTKEQSNPVINDYLQQINSKKMSKNKIDGEKFLAENKTKPGVTTLPSGLQYVILKEGTGPKPTINDKVKTHYHGTLIDGTVFDSSVDRGEPISFPVSGVIRGWTEALQLMPVGSKWKLFIPSELAYGERQAGPKIGPGSALVFEVELLAIEK